MSKLVELYLSAKYAYYETSTPIMSDSDFDALERRIVDTNPELVKRVGSERAGKVDLPVPLGSLDQLHDQGDLARWIATYPKGTKLVATEKIDGNSILLKYKNGILVDSFSRGNGVKGANNLRHISQMPDIPAVLPTAFTGTVRGEIAVPKELWTKCQALATSHSGKEYANARNFTAGFLNGKTGQADLYEFFKFVAFELHDPALTKEQMIDDLLLNKFTIPKYRIVDKDQYTFDQLRGICDTMIADSLFECDGIVLDVDAVRLRDQEVKTDPDDLNPSHARKLKPETGSATTTIIRVDWNISKDKYLKPTLHFEPVQLAGVTIRKASGYNAKYVFENGIGPGAVVNIKRMGEVIPRCDEVLIPTDVEMPADCHWNANKVDLISDSTTKLQEIQQQVLEHFFAKLEVEFVGAGNVTKLMDIGITTPINAINADLREFEIAIGSNGVKAYHSLQAKLAALTPAKLFAAMGSFGRGMGERKLTALFKIIPFEIVLSGGISANNIVGIDGFDIKSARKILDCVDDAREQYESVASLVTFVQPAAVITTGKFAGQVITPTGIRIKGELADAIRAQGGDITDTFSSKTTILVAKDVSSGSSKIEKAREKGIKVISLAELESMV